VTFSIDIYPRLGIITGSSMSIMRLKNGSLQSNSHEHSYMIEITQDCSTAVNTGRSEED
jgi:hypothetical protein